VSLTNHDVVVQQNSQNSPVCSCQKRVIKVSPRWPKQSRTVPPLGKSRRVPIQKR